MRCVIAALALFSALLSTRALAQEDQTVLGRRMAHDWFSAIGYDWVIATLERPMAQQNAYLGSMRPEWPSIMTAAAHEVLQNPQSQSAMEEILGRSLAKHYTADELKAGIQMFEGPGGNDIGLFFRALAEKKTPKPTAAARAAVARIQADPAGRSFVKKFGDTSSVDEDEARQFVIYFVPRVFARFGQLAQDAEGNHTPESPK